MSDNTPTWDGTGRPPTGALVDYWCPVKRTWNGPARVVSTENADRVFIEYTDVPGFDVVRSDDIHDLLRPYRAGDALVCRLRDDLEALPQVDSHDYTTVAQALAVGLRNGGFVAQGETRHGALLREARRELRHAQVALTTVSGQYLDKKRLAARVTEIIERITEEID
jgi:hypothetical protein